MFGKNKTLWKTIFLFCWLELSVITAYGKELVIATTLAPEGVQYLIDEWHKQPNTKPIITLNRTSTSLNQLFTTERGKEVDLILSSSPMLFYSLQQQQKLAELSSEFSQHSQQRFVPNMLQKTTVAFSLSGYGMLINPSVLERFHLEKPKTWQDLAHSDLQGLIIISSPTRSDTNHIMLETVLQQQGWQKGWALFNQIMANVGTISSRSFGVVDKIQSGLGGIGITIDNYGNLLTAQNDKKRTLLFHYFPDFTFSPTFIAVNQIAPHKQEAQQFIQFLLSSQGQAILNHSAMSKLPIEPLPETAKNYHIQQYLFKQPPIDYDLLLKRQHLVKLLFEQQITYRLSQLQENWRLLRQKESELGRELAELRQILNRQPVSEEESLNPQYLNHFHTDQTLLSWQKFFAEQQIDFIKAVEGLK